jgi:hypothetical protein
MSQLQVDTILNAAGTGAPNASSGLKVNGAFIGGTTSAKSADYTITDTDGFALIAMTTSSTNRTVTLPAAANNTNRVLTVKKVDSGTGYLILARAGSDTIDGQTSKRAVEQYDFIAVQSDGTNWHVLNIGGSQFGWLRLSGGNGHGSTNNKIRRFVTEITSAANHLSMTYADSSTNGGSITIVQDGIYQINYMDTGSTTINVGISVNSSQLTTSIDSITNADRVVLFTTAGGGLRSGGSGIIKLSAGDVVRAHTDGTANGTTDPNINFSMAQVQKL